MTSAAAPMVVNGWSIYVHPRFLKQLEGLIEVVDERKARNPNRAEPSQAQRATERIRMNIAAFIRERVLRLGLNAHRHPEGELTAIFVSPTAGEPMRPCNEALAIADRGLAEDRYALGRGFWRLTDGCQVTLIHAEDLQRAERHHGLSLSAGQHRRNLVLSGLAGRDLRGVSLRIGEALFEWHRVRPPCGYLDRISGPGMAKALGRHAGHCLRVREGGRLRVGDRVSLS